MAAGCCTTWRDCNRPSGVAGYKRAAKAIAAGIDRSVADLVEEGILRDVPFVGSSSERVVKELLLTGASQTVEGGDSRFLQARGSGEAPPLPARLLEPPRVVALDAPMDTAIVVDPRLSGRSPDALDVERRRRERRGLAEAAIELEWTRIGSPVTPTGCRSRGA